MATIVKAGPFSCDGASLTWDERQKIFEVTQVSGKGESKYVWQTILDVIRTNLWHRPRTRHGSEVHQGKPIGCPTVLGHPRLGEGLDSDDERADHDIGQEG